MTKLINIGIVGLGQVGNYLYNELKTKKKEIEKKTGKKIQVVAISAKNKNKKRRFKINKKILLLCQLCKFNMLFRTWKFSFFTNTHIYKCFDSGK